MEVPKRSVENSCNDYNCLLSDPGEQLVISGVAGRFPDCDNVKIFQEKLFNKVDLISDDDRRWKLDHPEIPQRTGKINNISKFDASFFGVHFKQAHTMDPMCRMLLEHAYEAVVDAGINPRQLRGSKTGVFIGACFSESEKTWFYEKLQVNGFGITGCSRAMLANRISYWLGLTGPSYAIDSACSSSLFAMEQAYRAIRDGLCDAAIVGGSNLCLHPYVSLQFSRLGVLSPDGACKSFDSEANGYARSESICIVYIQKAKHAKRIYATLIHTKTNCDGFKEQGITFPSSQMQGVLLDEFYKECGLPTTCLSYMEAHGTGTKVGDPEEINAIDKVFCKNRTTPLKLGSIKSNLGHSEPASGLCSVAKVLIAMETGIIPPNLHYKRPREGIKALEEGRIQVITEPTPWEGGYVGINSFGFGGANAHILLKSNTKEKINGGAPTDDLPRLVVVSGRTKEAVTVMLDDIDKHSVDVEYIRLIHDIYAESTSGHLYRGYTLVGYNDSKLPVREIEHFPGEKRPIWFVFSGMGSQWPGMGEDLMRLPIFAGTVKKCDAVLKPLGVNIYDILTSKDRKTFDNILNSFVGIAVVQIGLMDLLSCVGIVPDHIIGHSVGELGCAYADGCFTAEQMVLAAYYRGLASIETKVIYGCMAAVGLGYEALKDICPPDIEIACHNGPENSTISGPAESMKNFIASLQANNIFAKEVPCSNIPYHSRYIANAGPKLLAYLQKVIPEPKSRSPKWLSTSVPRTEWSSTLTQLSSAEYHTNNLLNPVLFAEIIALIPKNAITIEIAPHGLLQAILRNSLDPDIAKISLSQRNHKDNVKSLLQALGKLYNVGLQPQLAILYPPVEFPVSRSTPMISSNIRWEHSDDWYVTTYKIQEKLVSGERLVQVSLSDENLEFIAGHVIDGRNLFPAMGYIFLVWETIGMMRGQLFSEVSVVFEDITFLRATTVPKKGLVELLIMIQKGSGKFEIVEGDASVVTGVIRVSTDPMMLQQEMLHSDILPNEIENEDEAMSSGDIYKELKLRGYQYSGFFCGLQSATITGSKGHIRWMNNWVAFMDNMLQMQILSLDSRSLLVPTSIQKLIINPKVHMNHIRSISQEDKDLPVRVLKEFDIIISGGVEIRECRASSISRRKLMEKPVLEEYKFVAYRDREKINLREVLTLSCQIAVENVLTLTAKAIEIIDTDEQITNEQLVSPLILEILSDFPLIQANVILVAPSDKFDKESLSDDITLMEPSKIPKDANALLVVGSGLATKKNSDTLKQVLAVLKNDGFLLTRETTFNNEDLSDLQKLGLNIILEKRVAEESFILFRKKIKYPKKTIIIRLNNNEFSWLKEVQSVLDAVNDGNESIRAILLAEKDYESGLLGFINCLRREPSGEIFRGVLIQDNEGPEFSLENPFFDEQLQADLVINVLRYGNTWGSYRHLSLPTLDKQLVHHAYANQSIRGDLSSLCWYEGHIQEDNVSDNLVQIVYASLNFKDIMLATGKLSIEAGTKNKNIIECAIGIEYAGIDSSGRRIMGIQTNMCLSNLIVPDKHFYWEIPDRWSLEDGATIPCVYTTCYYALYMKSKIKKGDKILIHAGSGGIGQAAINLALYEGCEVFTTVGTEEKRAFIKKTFPSIDDDHIGNSRDTSFEQLILRQTKGRGVDIVLNSLAEEKLQASLRCLAEGGSFLEIGKFDFMMNNKLAMYVFLKDINFHSVMLDNMFTYETKSGVKYSLMKLVQKGISNGSIKPLVRTIFPKENLEKAFRFMAAGKHIGKIIIKVCDERKPLKEPMLAYPRFQCLKGRSYIIIGGLGGFALELADWLILRGAENLVLTSRSGIKNGYQRMRTELWKSYGINVLIIADRDCSNRDDCEYILQTANSLGPVDAIFNLAISLKDGICRNQTVENFEELFKSKVWNTKLLDKYSRIHCPYLRHFVVFSSISCGRGNAGQTNYGMGNSIMERICEKRVEEGLPGLAIQWGAIGDVGIIADMQANNKILETIGLLPQGIISCLQELDRFMKQSGPVVASMVLAEKRASGSGAKNVVEAVQNIMGLKDLKTISQHTPLAELGMDSMMAIEIKQTLEREFEIFLNAQDIRSLNFNKLIKMSENSTNQKNNEPVNSVQDETVLRGINLLVRSIGKEDFDFEPCINLETSIVDGKGEVFLIPGIEGYGSIFKNLLSYIKCPVTCLQLGINDNYKIVEDMAKYFLLYTLNKCKSTRNFAIVGYSFGTLIAIELVRRLEAEGLNGHLILIDGSPDQMKLLINQHLSDNNDVELQCKFLSALMDMLEPTRSLQLAATLHEYNTFEERLDEFLSCIPDNKHVKFSEENQKKFISVLYDRILAIKNYDPFSLPRIRSPIILLKPTLGNVQMSDEDYGLQKITQDKVQIHYVEGNHITVLDNPQIAKAINGESLEDAEAFKASIIGVGQVLTPLMADEHMRS